MSDQEETTSIGGDVLDGKEHDRTLLTCSAESPMLDIDIKDGYINTCSLSLFLH